MLLGSTAPFISSSVFICMALMKMFAVVLLRDMFMNVTVLVYKTSVIKLQSGTHFVYMNCTFVQWLCLNNSQ